MSQSVKEILKDKKKVRFVAESAFKQVDKDGTSLMLLK
jgi:calmodulin